MKIGILKTTANFSDADPRAAYKEFVRFAQEAEELGYWSIWTTEHHFASDVAYRPYGQTVEQYRSTDYDMSPDPFMLLNYAGAQTSRIKLGTAVSVLMWDHPIRVAERAAMLDHLSGGRLELGVGRGQGFREAQIFDVPTDNETNQRKYREGIELLRTAWRGEEFTWDGEFYKMPTLTMTPRTTGEIPLWVGCASDTSALWAAEQGLPFMTITWPLTGLDQFRKRLEMYREKVVETGYDTAEAGTPHTLYFYCGESDAEAEEVAYEYMMNFQYVLEQHYEFQRSHAENAVNVADDEAWSDLENLARFPIEHHIIGSPDTCAERLDFFQREIGVDYAVLITSMGTIPADLSSASVRRFGEKVLPKFSSVPAGV
jgi:alkanesulfonate monooxygenase SsuD/methylene tetrahydromethanopterin reductase-like flavin-dependent oxidoreductase (luciferase family)